MDCAPALAKIAEEAGQVSIGVVMLSDFVISYVLLQEIPEFLKIAAAKGGKGKGNKLWRY